MSKPTKPTLTKEQFREIFLRLSDDQQDSIIKLLERMNEREVGDE